MGLQRCCAPLNLTPAYDGKCHDNWGYRSRNTQSCKQRSRIYYPALDLVVSRIPGIALQVICKVVRASHLLPALIPESLSTTCAAERQALPFRSSAERSTAKSAQRLDIELVIAREHPVGSLEMTAHSHIWLTKRSTGCIDLSVSLRH